MITLFFVFAVVAVGVKAVHGRNRAKVWIEEVFSERDAHIRQRIAGGASSEEISGLMGIPTHGQGPFDPY